MHKQEYEMPQAELAARLRHQRTVEGLTQQQAAAAVGMARKTLVAIEQGKRSIGIEELQQLAHAYGTSVNWLLARDATRISLSVQFRKSSSCPKRELDRARSLLTRLVEAELAFENILGIDSRREHPVLEALDHDCEDEIAAAENDADRLRRKLGIGISPIQDMTQLLEFGLNMRLYIREVHSGISGMWSASDYGGCILLNSRHPPERNNFSSAHELGHFVWSAKSKNRNLHGSRRSTEKYANHFASSFLMPKKAIREHVGRLASESTLTMRSLILLSGIFNVSVPAMVLRLEGLNIASGLSDIIEDQGGFSQKQGNGVLDEAGMSANGKYRLQRIYRLAAVLSEKALLSEEQLFRMLCLNRLQLREILCRYDAQSAGSC